MKYSIYIMDSKPFEQTDVYEKSLELVSEYRKSKVQRLRRKEDKAASLAAGSLLAYAFREYAGIDERQVIYTKNRSGKPMIIDNYDEQFGLGQDAAGVDSMCTAKYRNMDADIQFSLSHTEGCVAVVVGMGKCGIDVERVRRIPESIVNRLYSDEDSEMIRYIEKQGNKADIFSTTVWTRREAYGKMTGTGILMSDVDQKMVMQDKYMLKNAAKIISLGIQRCEGDILKMSKEHLTECSPDVWLTKSNAPYSYVYSVCIDSQVLAMKERIISYQDVITELS